MKAEGRDPTEPTGNGEMEDEAPVTELSRLTPIGEADLVEPVLNSLRRRESTAYLVGFVWGGLMEVLHAVGEWITSAPLLTDDVTHRESTRGSDDSIGT